MKKLFFLLSTAALVIGCNSQKSQNSESDSAALVDSGYQTDSASLDSSTTSVVTQEQNSSVMLDSIKEQNSPNTNNDEAQKSETTSKKDIADTEEKKTAYIPTFKDILKHGQSPSYFKNKGFMVSVKNASNERDGKYKIVTATYQPSPGVTYKFKDSTVGDDRLEITVDGAPDVLNKIYSEAKAYVNSMKRDCPNYRVSKNGNTIKCVFDDYVY